MLLLFTLIPFFYLQIFGIKIALLLSILNIRASTSNLLKDILNAKKINTTSRISFLLIIYTILLSINSNDVKILAATCVFILIQNLNFPKSYFNLLKIIYFFSAFFCASGILFQKLIFYINGETLFRYEVFHSRTAFSFIWDDYSFISLFLVSSLPLLEKKFHALKIIIILGCLASSARTGIVALLIFYLIYYNSKSLKTLFFSKKKKISEVILGLSSILLAITFPFIFEIIADRKFSLSSLDRINDFTEGFHFIKENFLFGASLNNHYYFENVGTPPHNMFIFNLYIGGLFYFLISTLYFLSIAFDIKNKDQEVKNSIFICFIGLQFIPTPFSAYFIACLIALAKNRK